MIVGVVCLCRVERGVGETIKRGSRLAKVYGKQTESCPQLPKGKVDGTWRCDDDVVLWEQDALAESESLGVSSSFKRGGDARQNLALFLVSRRPPFGEISKPFEK